MLWSHNQLLHEFCHCSHILQVQQLSIRRKMLKGDMCILFDFGLMWCSGFIHQSDKGIWHSPVARPAITLSSLDKQILFRIVLYEISSETVSGLRSMVNTHTWLVYRMLRSAYLNIIKVHGFTQPYIYANPSHSSAAAVSNNLWELLIIRVLPIQERMLLMCMCFYK